ncbi:SUKH-3 domain-containing protein [Streptomyces sp. NPDC002306]
MWLALLGLGEIAVAGMYLKSIVSESLGPDTVIGVLAIVISCGLALCCFDEVREAMRRTRASICVPAGRATAKNPRLRPHCASFPEKVEKVLRDAGWTCDRQVDPEAWLSALEADGFLQRHHAVSAFLAEFGGLAVHISGSGISCARVPFVFDPMLCLGEEDRFSEWSGEIKKSIFPIGLLDGRFCLGIDEDSEIYLVETWVASFGRMPEAMSNLILGVESTVVHDGSE